MAKTKELLEHATANTWPILKTVGIQNQVLVLYLLYIKIR